MNFAISWVLGLFKKPEVEVAFDKADIKAWPFPVETKKKRPQVKKATTRKPTVKKPVAKKATKVVKKAIKKAK
jgi:hypothetical protein